ncbi:MAG: hypothetical protein IT445_06040 [Phycisphaeraceae bacterium]|nr:hypothetical protein [Phycisphaeraceae bacterium]
MQAKRLSPGEQPVPGGAVSPSRGGRCVLLTPPQEAPGLNPWASTLIDALVRRGLAVIVVNDPPRAMLELLRCNAAALIVADPEQQQQAAQLIEAVRTARPHTVCWQYCQRHGRQTLEPINGRLGDVQIKTEQLKTEPDSVSPVQRTESSNMNHATDAAEPLISADELAMLLGPPIEDES